MNKTNRSEKDFRYSSENWLGKVCAAIVLGFTLTIGLTGLLLHYGFGQVGIFSTEGQFLMWLMCPIWLSILSACFLFRTSLHAWFYLTAANFTVWAGVLSSPLFSLNNL